MTNAASTPDERRLGTLAVAPRLGSFLEEYGEIATILPVLAGLLVTSRLQLRGAQALLVNLAIAAIARQAVIQLKKQAHQVSEIPVTSNGHATDEVPTQIVEDYLIVHSTFGRIRLRIPRLISDAAYAQRLEKLLLTDERVTAIRLSRAAASLVIQYDGNGVTELELGMRLLQILEQAETGSQPELAYMTAES